MKYFQENKVLYYKNIVIIFASIFVFKNRHDGRRQIFEDVNYAPHAHIIEKTIYLGVF